MDLHLVSGRKRRAKAALITETTANIMSGTEMEKRFTKYSSANVENKNNKKPATQYVVIVALDAKPLVRGGNSSPGISHGNGPKPSE